MCFFCIMPPKKSNAPKASTEKKKVQKIVEDKTFGLKNKNKSKKVQQYIKGLQNSVTSSKAAQQAMKEAEEKKAARKLKEEQEKQLEKLFKGLPPKKETAPVEIKKKICPYFMKGRCPRGDECKLSHDWADTRKVEKQNLYEDPREGTPLAPTSEITCMHFVEAVEKNKYGHFWKCPNTEKCIYQHKLPKGYVIKTEEEKKLEAEGEVEEFSLEEKIEMGRSDLINAGGNKTPITEETYRIWRAAKDAKKLKELELVHKEAQKRPTKGANHVMSGRALFLFDPALFKDDADAADKEEVTIREKSEQELNENVSNVEAIDESLFTEDAELPEESDDEKTEIPPVKDE